MKKETYSVEVIGFGQTELMALASVFELSSRRVPKFVKHEAASVPDIFLVDADDAGAIKRLGERNASGSVPAILIGASNQGTAWPVLPRPIRWMKLFQAFDAAVGPAAAQEKPAAGPSPSAEKVAVAAPVAGTAGKPSRDWVLVVDDNQTV
ncbi:MAG TPA: hypothetical protein VGD24_05510, partial [Gallionella sp.]